MRVPVNEPVLDGNEKNYLIECIETGWISSEGPFVERFENDFAKFIGRKHGVAVSSGTAALDIAIEALGFAPGDEIILPTFTIISCVQQILRKGVVPVFVDADPYHWNMDVTEIENKITERTKAIMAVHIYGLTPDLGQITKLCQDYNLILIEDFAEAIGQTFNGQKCGKFGTISIASFYPNKHITTGEGGMILMDDGNLLEACKSLKNLCFGKKQRFVHEKLGWNYRMTNMQAAIGLAQLERVDEFVEKKRWIGAKYNDLLSLDSDVFTQPLKATEYNENIYWVYGLVSNLHNFDYVSIVNELSNLGIGTRPFFYPLHNQPVVKKMCRKNTLGNFPVAEKLGRFGFYVPSGLAITSEQIEYVRFHVNNLSHKLKNA